MCRLSAVTGYLLKTLLKLYEKWEKHEKTYLTTAGSQPTPLNKHVNKFYHQKK